MITEISKTAMGNGRCKRKGTDYTHYTYTCLVVSTVCQEDQFVLQADPLVIRQMYQISSLRPTVNSILILDATGFDV